ncbi:hypothetical protein FRC04_001889 [Tulasnella sp. 424]|nr:hypothetical protein FRC04_001889 [Tulasnella sp. 424]KAG8977668.1 hypothetical protein FRC05_000924 [Tulasnella sp. 425]
MSGGVQPLPSNPQLTIYQNTKCELAEYRIENWGSTKGGLRPSSGWTFGHFVFPALVFFVDRYLTPDQLWIRVAECVLVLWWITHSLIWQSITAIPGLGVQLETHYGLPHTPLSSPISLGCSRRFIPLASIMDIVMNEGLSGWGFRYYLAVIYKEGSNGEQVKVAVPFKDVQTFGVMLKEVYHGLRETLFDEYDDTSD